MYSLSRRNLDDVGVDGPAGTSVIVDQAGVADLAHDWGPLYSHRDDRGLNAALVASRRGKRFDFDAVASDASDHDADVACLVAGSRDTRGLSPRLPFTDGGLHRIRSSVIALYSGTISVADAVRLVASVGRRGRCCARRSRTSSRCRSRRARRVPGWRCSRGRTPSPMSSG
jgi:hypothetical protein